MIQRIQTIFLLLAALAFGALFLLPFASTESAGNDVIFADAEYTVEDHPILFGLVVLGVVFAIAAIFAFRNHSVQKRLGYLLIVVCIALPVVAYLYFTSMAHQMSLDQEVSDRTGMYMPLIGLLFTILALRFIRKDERLIKSMDRLR